MTRLGRHVPLVVGMWVLGALPALAHEDTFAWTYPYMTPDRGERELELRTVMGSASGYQKNELELEWGVTDRFSIAPYVVFARDNGGEALHADALKLELRGRLADPGAWPVDVGGYLEVEYTLAPDDPKALESKLILERDWGPWTIGANAILTQLTGASSDTLYGGTLGLAYAVASQWTVGVEALSGRAATDISPDPTDRRAMGTYVGPSLAGYFGAAHLNLAIAGGVTPGSDPVLARLQLSTEF